MVKSPTPQSLREDETSRPYSADNFPQEIEPGHEEPEECHQEVLSFGGGIAHTPLYDFLSGGKKRLFFRPNQAKLMPEPSPYTT